MYHQVLISDKYNTRQNNLKYGLMNEIHQNIYERFFYRKCNMIAYFDRNNPAVFFGINSNNDLSQLMLHQSNALIIWLDDIISLFNKVNGNIISKMYEFQHIVLFPYQSKALTSYGIDHYLYPLYEDICPKYDREALVKIANNKLVKDSTISIERIITNSDSSSIFIIITGNTNEKALEQIFQTVQIFLNYQFIFNKSIVHTHPEFYQRINECANVSIQLIIDYYRDLPDKCFLAINLDDTPSLSLFNTIINLGQLGINTIHPVNHGKTHFSYSLDPIQSLNSYIKKIRSERLIPKYLAVDENVSPWLEEDFYINIWEKRSDVQLTHLLDGICVNYLKDISHKNCGIYQHILLEESIKSYFIEIDGYSEDDALLWIADEEGNTVLFNPNVALPSKNDYDERYLRTRYVWSNISGFKEVIIGVIFNNPGDNAMFQVNSLNISPLKF